MSMSINRMLNRAKRSQDKRDIDNLASTLNKMSAELKKR